MQNELPRICGKHQIPKPAWLRHYAAAAALALLTILSPHAVAGPLGLTEPASSPPPIDWVHPVLPDWSSPCGCFVFRFPQPRRPHDPPFATSFTYALSGAVFTEFAIPPMEFGFGSLTFTDLGGTNPSFVATPGVQYSLLPTTKFRISGILAGLIDSESPGFASAFPAYLDWTGTARLLVIHAGTGQDGTGELCPEPSTYALLGAGLLGLGLRRRR